MSTIRQHLIDTGAIIPAEQAIELRARRLGGVLLDERAHAIAAVTIWEGERATAHTLAAKGPEPLRSHLRRLLERSRAA